MILELWDRIPADIKKLVIAWAIVSGGLWLFKLLFGVGMLLALLLLVAVIAALKESRDGTRKVISGREPTPWFGGFLEVVSSGM